MQITIYIYIYFNYNIKFYRTQQNQSFDRNLRRGLVKDIYSFYFFKFNVFFDIFGMTQICTVLFDNLLAFLR